MWPRCHIYEHKINPKPLYSRSVLTWEVFFESRGRLATVPSPIALFGGDPPIWIASSWPTNNDWEPPFNTVVLFCVSCPVWPLYRLCFLYPAHRWPLLISSDMDKQAEVSFLSGATKRWVAWFQRSVFCAQPLTLSWCFPSSLVQRETRNGSVYLIARPAGEENIHAHSTLRASTSCSFRLFTTSEESQGKGWNHADCPRKTFSAVLAFSTAISSCLSDSHTIWGQKWELGAFWCLSVGLYGLCLHPFSWKAINNWWAFFRVLVG